MTDRIQKLRRAAQARHDRTLRRADAALTSLARQDEPVTVCGVADAARVSRSWIYQQPQLLAEISRLRQPSTDKRPGAAPSQRPPPTRCASNCTPTAKRSPGCAPRSPRSTSNSPASSAPPAPRR